MAKMFGHIATVECATGMSDEVVAEAKDIMRKQAVSFLESIDVTDYADSVVIGLLNDENDPLCVPKVFWKVSLPDEIAERCKADERSN